MDRPPIDTKVQVQVDPDEDTEWNDILRAHGVIPEKPKDPNEDVEEAIAAALQERHENRLEGKDLDELDELEDDEDEEFLEKYRRQRIAQMKELAAGAKFGSVYGVNKPEYKKEVTEASNDSYVVVQMSDGRLQSRLLAQIFTQLAPKYPEIKFVDIVANRAVENYPESNCPTLLVYHDGDVVKQYITLAQLGGNSTTANDIESVLIDSGAIKENDRRVEQEDRRMKFVRKQDDHEEDDFFD